MPHDTLETVVRLRRRAVDECQVALAVGIAVATSAVSAARASERAIADEMEAASAVHGSRSTARAARTVARCRAELAGCRTALETIECLRDRRRAEAQAASAAAERRELDEAALRRLDSTE